MSVKPKANHTQKEYEELGRMLETLYETGYTNPKTLLKMSFLKGIAAGFGGVLGATILVALLAGILSLFDSMPLIGPLADKINDTVQTQPK